MKQVSVIVPVYNGERYLRQCLDSICNQTLSDIEIICVDDGSTDSSYSILQQYAQRDDRFQIYTQQNQYAGVARNVGISHASGECLVFWDCDDFFELQALERMYETVKMHNADVCVCGANQYFENKNKVYPFEYIHMDQVPGIAFNQTTNPKYILSFTNAAPWNKMFRREFVLTHNLQFQAIRNGNDVYFVEMALALAEKIVIVNEPLVNYRRNQSQGLVNSLDRSVRTPIETWMCVAASLQEQDAFPEQSYVNKMLNSMIYMLRNIKRHEPFVEAVQMLQDNAEQLCLIERPVDYYYNKSYQETAEHLLQDTPDEFKSFLAYQTYIQLTESGARNRSLRQDREKLRAQREKLRRTRDQLKHENAQLKKEIEQLRQQKDALQHSRSYRLGCMLTWIPRQFKGKGE